MVKRKFATVVLFGSTAIFSCAPQGSGMFGGSESPKGVIVYYLESPKRLTLKCSSPRLKSSHAYLPEIYISKNNIKGNISPADRDIVYSAVLAYLTEAQYVNPITKVLPPKPPTMSEEQYQKLKESYEEMFPNLKITVDSLTFKKWTTGNKVVERATFTGSMRITFTDLEAVKNLLNEGVISPDELVQKLASVTTVCNAEAVSKSAEDVKSKLKSYELKPAETLKLLAVKKAVREIVSQFSPQKVSTFRPVKYGNKYRRVVANALNNGNYEMAIEFGERYLKNEKNKNDYGLLYDVGVAYEVKAWNSNSLDETISNLERARNYYKKAFALVAERGTNDKDLDTALNQVQKSLTHLGELKKLIKAYEELKKKTQELFEKSFEEEGF